jgi:hypothetical protein
MSNERADESTAADIERHREKHRRRTEELAAQDIQARKELHWMHCPKCGSDLEEFVFRGVKIDKCFGCGGVYLDDGELEQLAGKPGWFEALRYLFSGE